MDKRGDLNSVALTRRYPISGKWSAERRNLVTSFGLCWSREEARFDTAGIKAMRGRCSHQGFSDLEIDFWTHSGAYILFGDSLGKEPVYVGIAGNGGLGSRIRAHVRGREKIDGWSFFSWFSSGPVLDDLGYRLRRSSVPRKALAVGEIHIWHDFEAVIYRAFNREIKNKRRPVFGGSCLEFDQVTD